MDLTGIKNENEFYTQHYLTALLAGDLKDVLKEWSRREKEEGVRSPASQLSVFAKSFFQLKEQARQQIKAKKRRETQLEALHGLLQCAGYSLNPRFKALDDGNLLPLIAEVNSPDGSPLLWVLEALPESDAEIKPEELYSFAALKASLQPEQYEDPVESHTLPAELAELDWEALISKEVFGQEEPPRWVLLCSFSQILLIDRKKWNEKRLLSFDLDEILGRRETSTLNATMALLHSDSLCPEGKQPLLDELDEKSHKNAYGVTGKLKEALRESIELLGNEAIWYLTEVSKRKIYDLGAAEFKRVYGIELPEGRTIEQELTIECLRYMYRLLFLFYIEARPELGYAPLKSATYLKGYSLESLRNLELVKLTTDESRDGSYIHETLQMLFEMVYQGVGYRGLGSEAESAQRAIVFSEAGEVDDFYAFRMTALQSHLFDPDRTPLLNKVEFRNSVLQQIIHKMSLTGKGEKSQRTGRISYATLGITQLGQVYEALLSYRGFFAETDLYEVKPAKDEWNPLEHGYFVKAEDLPQYSEDEKVKLDGKLLKHDKGRFIYRMAGRDREKSASYYTPEVLTQCLVKYALKELLQDKTADDILQLKVCEPAMGSAAFLNEAVNQLAEAYLHRKQQELGQSIPHDEMLLEKQKVKMYIADNNVFGVDLNPIAVELAEISLWLNTIYKAEDEKAFVPWFGLQLVCGNSLVGARREVYNMAQLSGQYWTAAPTRVPLQGGKLEDEVWHFLLPDPKMAAYDDKVIKELAPETIGRINRWRQEFMKPFSEEERNRLRQLSKAIDKLWQIHAREEAQLRDRTTDPISIYGREGKGMASTIRTKDKMLEQEYYSRQVRNSSAYRRLKMVMDYWCALWFWPLTQIELLPNRNEFLDDLRWFVDSNIYSASAIENDLPLFASTYSDVNRNIYLDELGVVDIDKVVENWPRLKLVVELSRIYRFHHWELEFADVFANWGGFDLVIGNPPWIKLEWKEANFLGEIQPKISIRSENSDSHFDDRIKLLSITSNTTKYLEAFEEVSSTLNFLNAYSNYPLLKGIQTNLYKCFIPKAWLSINNNGLCAFVNQDGIYNDPDGGNFREECYKRLRLYFEFLNEKRLFPIGHTRRYEMNIFGPKGDQINFKMIANVIHPATIDSSLIHSGMGDLPPMKDAENNWVTAGHRDRIISVNYDNLKFLQQIFDDNSSAPQQARLGLVYSSLSFIVLKRFAAQTAKLHNFRDEYAHSVMLEEKKSIENGLLIRSSKSPSNPSELVLAGSHIYVSNPIYKSPIEEIKNHHDYYAVDLTKIKSDYLPRTNLLPQNTSKIVDQAKIQLWNNQPITNAYRWTARKVLSQSGERTLISAIIPPGVMHLDSCFSISFKDSELLLQYSSLTQSIVYDFWLKTTGKKNFRDELASMLPIVKTSKYTKLLMLLLNCLTSNYSSLWSESWDETFSNYRWTKCDPRLDNNFFATLGKDWQREFPLRFHFQRRQAQIENDVLVSMSMGLTLKQLQSIYNLQFPVLKKHENDTWYDANGRIVFTNNSQGLKGIGLDRKQFAIISGMRDGEVYEHMHINRTHPSGSFEETVSYVAPFERCNRENDYATVWAEFEQRFLSETSQYSPHSPIYN